MATLQNDLLNRVSWIDKRNHWKINVQKDGVRKSFYSSVQGKKGRTECAEKAAKWLLGSDTHITNSRTTVDDVFQMYLKDKELETTNVDTIRSRYNNHIKPLIGKVPIIRLTKQDLKRVILTAYKIHDLSRKTLLNLRGDLSNFCNYLDASDIRNDLRTDNIKIPAGARRSDKKCLRIEDLSILFEADEVMYNGKVCRDNLVYAYRFHVATGLRPGELMGLEWGDVDQERIHIRRAINAKGQRTSGKNEFAERDFPITKHILKILNSQKQYRTNPENSHERIFGDIGQLCYRERWHKYCEYNGIPYITPYELRHTFASMYKDNLGPWVLDELMGHVHEGMTLGVYAHRMEGDMETVSEVLDNVLDHKIEAGKTKRRLMEKK